MTAWHGEQCDFQNNEKTIYVVFPQTKLLNEKTMEHSDH
jgi:hypothetical protein